ncbi:uncharacterized protein [Mytilus edulis]|uniref:uncharacterized protein isoform X1 n=1 Tax=Mytilus edulis TaxID=6550 RepID=UPI0039EF7D7F
MSPLICVLFLVVAAAAYDYVGSPKTVVLKHSALGDVYGIGSPSVVSYLDYSNKFHGFKISNSRFTFGGIGYKLNCDSQRFYNLWGNCWSIYHSRSVCFDRLRKQHLFNVFPGGNDFNDGAVVVKNGVYGNDYDIGVGSVVSYGDYFNKYHGFKISDSRFSYGGHTYALKCGLQRFYNLWGNCWSSYHSRSVCFGRLRKQHLFDIYSADYDVDDYDLGVGSVISYGDYFNKYHGFKIRDSRFSYGGHAYTLKCGLQRFYNLWGNCWSSYHSRSVCFGRLRKLHLFDVYSGDYDVDDYDLGVGSVVSYGDYFNKYHGFKISDNRFSYGGHAYTLKCGLQRFYNLWGNCWSSYHSRSVCFGRLRTQHLFDVYSGGYDVDGGVYGDDYDLGVGSVVSYGDYFNKYHGFKISDSRFSYGGHAYTLKCGLRRFYNLWGNCWTRYHSRKVCFGRLRKQHLFDIYSGDIDYDGGHAVVKSAVYNDLY